MKSQEPIQQSTQRDANLQACGFITGISLFFCVLVSIIGWWAWLTAPQIISMIATRAKDLFITTPKILFVRPDGTSYSCGSWENACGLQTALAVARAGDEIWVQAGIYKPAEDTSSLEATFQLMDGVALYGGFAGTETARDQRDWETHITVLSGDLGGDDTTDPNGVVTDTMNIVGQNAYHVVTGSGVDNTGILDGFVITAGYASLTPPALHGYGGGMINWEGSPTLNNLIFSGNTAGKGKAYYGGGGMFNTHLSNPTLTKVTFIANTAGSGGGMYNDGSNPMLTEVSFFDNKAGDASCINNYINSSPILNGVVFDGNSSSNKGCMVNHVNSNPVLSDVTFSNNTAKYGAGIYNTQSSPTLTDVVFLNNRALLLGGAMENEAQSNPILTNILFSGNSASQEGGGIYNHGSKPTLTNVTFSDNSAGKFGGGICNTFSSGPELINVTFIGNQAPHGGGICNVGGSFKLVNGIVWGNTPSQEQIYNDNVTPDITYSDIQGGFPGEGNLNVAPRFREFREHGRLTSLFTLLPDSPVIDKGSPLVCPTTDQTGYSRPVDGDGEGSATCDMGAYEYRTPE